MYRVFPSALLANIALEGVADKTMVTELEGKKYRIDDQRTLIVVATDSETRAIKANVFMLALTNVLLEMWQEGIKPLALRWFWLETNSYDMGTAHIFFVVDGVGDRIVCEEKQFLDYPESAFNRDVFEPDFESRHSGLDQSPTPTPLRTRGIKQSSHKHGKD